MIAPLLTHVPEAEEIIRTVSNLDFSHSEEECVFDVQDGDILCKEGVSLPFYEKARLWLDAKEGRRLFWIEKRPQQLAWLARDESALALLKDPRTRIFFVRNSLEAQFAAKKIGWMSAFKELMILSDTWKEMIERAHQAAELIASDAADFGVTVARHLKENFRSPMRSLAALRGSMKRIPAIIVGAGPSLEKNGHLLEGLQEKTLLIATGSALKAVKIRPDLVVALDPHQPLAKSYSLDTVLCLQGRAHPETRKNRRGEVIYFPDSHYAFESWLTQSPPFNGGWTVGNAAVRIAIELGCDPIVLVGMDYCYKGTQKYADDRNRADISSLVNAVDAAGREVLTQRDWLMAISWMEETAKAHPEIQFFNATIGGMRIGAPFRSLSLIELQSDASDVSERWKAVVQSAPLIAFKKESLQAWEESLARCKAQELEETQAELPVQGEIAYDLLLEPLWRIWAPLFERELMNDRQPLPMKKKLAIQKQLFFNQVIEEHLNLNREMAMEEP